MRQWGNEKMEDVASVQGAVISISMIVMKYQKLRIFCRAGTAEDCRRGDWILAEETPKKAPVDC